MNTELKKKMSKKSATTTPETALTVSESNFIAFTENAHGIITENLKGKQLSYQMLDVVKSPSGGTTAFSVPGVSGDENAKELIGVILDYTTPRAYWDTPDPKEGTPPICFSRDSIVSHEGTACATCPYNDFGSKDGDSNAKACKESVVILLLRPDNIMPIIVRIPVSSKLRFQKYTGRLVGTLTPINSVVTKITLEKATNKTGQPFAHYNFEKAEELGDDEVAAAKAFGAKFAEILSIDTEVEPIETELAESA
jgi:hypothetical protein